MVLGIPVIQPPGRSKPLEFARVNADAGSREQITNSNDIRFLHRFFLRIGT
jgi:hypothetical protein